MEQKRMHVHNKAIAETIAEMLKLKGAKDVHVTEHPALGIFVIRWEQENAS